MVCNTTRGVPKWAKFSSVFEEGQVVWGYLSLVRANKVCFVVSANLINPLGIIKLRLSRLLGRVDTYYLKHNVFLCHTNNIIGDWNEPFWMLLSGWTRAETLLAVFVYTCAHLDGQDWRILGMMLQTSICLLTASDHSWNALLWFTIHSSLF